MTDRKETTMANEITITIVPDSPCPDCGAAWGHPDPALDFPNRPKVGGDDGVWYWRCYNPACPREYYIPLL